MSLKTIHVLFITSAVLLALGFGVWCLQTHAAHGNGAYLTTAIASFGSAIALVIYEFRFLRKHKNGGWM